MMRSARTALKSFLLLAIVAASKDEHRVTSLPGLSSAAANGTQHFSGYLDVQAMPGVQTKSFYYYVQHPDPDKPLLVWMNGGPGASSLEGLFTELGPILLNSRSLPEAGGGEWGPLINPYAWSNEASLLVWEQPAGVGFSRCVMQPCPIWNDTSVAAANLQTLLAFFALHPAEQSRPMHISGESYAGVYVPMLAQQVHEHNARLPAVALAATTSPIQLRGIIVGNGCVGYAVDGGCGLDSLQLLVTVLEQGAPGVDRGVLAAARSACEGELDQGFAPDQLSSACRPAVDAVLAEIGEYNEYSYGSPCGPDGSGNWGDGAGFSCGGDVALQRYLSSAAAQHALHVLPAGSDTPLKWQAWDGDSPLYTIIADNVVPTYGALLRQGYGVTIYNGLRDTAVPSQGAIKWIRSLGNGTEVAPRRKWSAPSVGAAGVVAGPLVAGYVTRYANGIQFATIIGAGHLAPAERPASALTLINAVLRAEPLPEYTGPACKRLWLGRGYGDFC